MHSNKGFKGLPQTPFQQLPQMKCNKGFSGLPQAPFQQLPTIIRERRKSMCANAQLLHKILSMGPAIAVEGHRQTDRVRIRPRTSQTLLLARPMLDAHLLPEKPGEASDLNHNGEGQQGFGQSFLNIPAYSYIYIWVNIINSVKPP